METQDKGYTGYKTVGAKYQSGRDVADIAKDLRAEIKALVKANILPQGTYSVTISRYSGGRSIDIKVTEFEFPILNPERIAHERQYPHEFLPTNHTYYPLYSKIARMTLDQLNAMLNAHRFDDSDGMIDYFHTNFYGNASFDWKLETKEREAFLTNGPK